MTAVCQDGSSGNSFDLFWGAGRMKFQPGKIS